MKRQLLLALVLLAATADVHATSGPFAAKIAFVSNRDGNNEIYVMNANGSSPARLTTDPTADIQPAFSPDGTKIAFVSHRDGNDEIYVMNANGTEQTRLTNNVATDSSPAWSPDGLKIVFQSSRNGGFDIFSMFAAAGDGVTQLTNSPGFDTDPAFSLDGTKIVFSSNRDGNNEIYTMNPNGSSQTRLTNNTVADKAPDFSPDGKKIVWVTQVAINGGEFTSQIAVMSANGVSQSVLTSESAGHGTNNNPVFSPDGTRIFFESTRDQNREIYSMKPDGTSQTRVTNNLAFDSSPSCLRDFQEETIGVYRPSTGQWLLRNTNTSGAPNIIINFGGQPGDLPVTGDWNGDHRTDIGVFRNGTFVLGVLFEVFGNFAVQEQPVFAFGQAGDLPVAGDWNDDGVDDVGVFRPGTTGKFLLRQPFTNSLGFVFVGTISFNFGKTGDLPIAGDWDGDGLETPGVYRQGDPGPFILTNGFSGTQDIVLDLAGVDDVPLAGDWLGQGADRPGIFRPTTGFMFLATELAQKISIAAEFGQPGDMPVAGNWRP